MQTLRRFTGAQNQKILRSLLGRPEASVSLHVFIALPGLFALPDLRVLRAQPALYADPAPLDLRVQHPSCA